MSSTDFDVIVAGGGLNGPALALALARTGMRVAVADPRPAGLRAQPGFDARAYALSHASQRLLAALDVWPALREAAQPIMQVKAAQSRRGGGAGAFFLHFDSAEIEEAPLGWMVEDRHLSAALDAAMASSVSRMTAGVLNESPTAAGIEVTLTDGTRLNAQLLVGADGRGSGVAARAGIRRVGWDYGQTAIVCAVDHALPHHGVAHQLFLPEGPLALLPLPENRMLIVWSQTRGTGEALAALPDDAFMEALAPRFGDFLGAITLAGPRFTYPLSLSLAERYVAPRRALIGDAAHGVHPIAGQGLNLGLQDVAALAECVVDAARRGEDIGTEPTLERYEAWRRFDATTLALGMDSVNRLFSNQNPLVAAVRGLGMGAVQAIPALRQRFMRQAAGLAMDPMPRLLRGRPL